MSDDSLEARIYALEQQMAKTQLSIALTSAQLEQNTRLTEAVKKDTSEITDLLKGFKVLGGIAKWVLAIVAMAGLLVGFFKGFYIGNSK